MHAGCGPAQATVQAVYGQHLKKNQAIASAQIFGESSTMYALLHAPYIPSSLEVMSADK
jgi:hypothetical protein